jgi:hypothetical protein
LRSERDAYGRLILEYLETGEGIEIVERDAEFAEGTGRELRRVIDEGEHVYGGVLERVR